MADLRILATAVLLLASLPSASAAEAEGVVTVAGPAELLGVTLESTGADVMLDEPGGVLITASSLDVERRAHSTSSLPNLQVQGVTDKPAQTTHHESATVRIEPAAGEPRFGLRLLGPLVARSEVATMSPVLGVRIAGDPSSPRDDCSGVTPPCLDAYGVHEFAGTDVALEGSGDLVLVLHGFTAIVESSGETTRYVSGESEGTAPMSVQREDAVLTLTLSGATLRVEAPSARVYAPSPTIAATRIILPDVTGQIDVGLRTYRPSNADLRANGDLVLLPELAQAGSRFGPTGKEYGESFQAQIQGDVQSINLAAVPVYAEPEAQATGFAAVAAILVGTLAYFWPHVSFQLTSAMLPLYTRLQPPEILDNDVRNAIYEIIRTTPGISARAVHRASGQSWGTVVYHLRQLESHHLVVSRRFGRARNYYENHGKYKGMEQQLACLRSPRARTLARAILAEPGLTQEGLALAAQLAQPTTSYYARKLTQAGLVVEGREGRYVRYSPTAELERFLKLAESPDAAAAPAPSVAA